MTLRRIVFALTIVPLVLTRAVVSCTAYGEEARGGGGDASSTGDAPSSVATDGAGGTDGSSPSADAAPPCDTTKISIDPKHCGACNHDCLGGACAAGVCQPSTFATDVQPRGLTIQKDALVWCGGGGVMSKPLSAAAEDPPTRLLAETGATGVTTDGTSLYLSIRERNTVLRVENGLPAWSHTQMVTPVGVSFADGRLFVAAQTQDSVHSMTAALGDGLQLVADRLNFPSGIAVSDGTVFVASASGILAHRIGAVRTVSPASRFGGGDVLHDGVAVFGDTVFFTLTGQGIVASVPVVGGVPATVIAPKQPSPHGIAVTDKAVYWANTTSGTIMQLAR